MVQRGVEVDVVRDGEGQVQRDAVEGMRVPVGARVAPQRGERRAGSRPGAGSRGHERVEGRCGEGAAEGVDEPVRREPGEVEHPVALERPGARRAAGRGEDAEGVVHGPHAAG